MSEENQEHDVTPGAMPWTELISKNKEESINFYSGLFGWTTEEMGFAGWDYVHAV